MPERQFRLQIVDDDNWHDVQRPNAVVPQRRPENQRNQDPPRETSIISGIGLFIISNPRLMTFLVVVLSSTYYNWELIHDWFSSFRKISTDQWDSIFMFIFFCRYFRFFCHIYGTLNYTPAFVPLNPTWGPQHTTVILPTIDPDNEKFTECMNSVLANRPAAIMIVTVGAAMRERCNIIAAQFRAASPGTEIGVSAIPHPSKRRQVAHAVPEVRTEFTILADDHVFWPSHNFISSALAPFEDPNIGVVATFKRVRRTTPGKWSVSSVLNLIGCFYLQRHNWELRASNGLDGGVFVVSGRTAVYRSNFLKAPGLMERFCSERFFMGIFGGEGLGPDDDNFLTREAYGAGWEIKFQETQDCVIETTIGDEFLKKFRGQLVRWARTTFRSNPCMLMKCSLTLKRMPWSYFNVYVAGMVNFALFWDAMIVCSFYNSWFCHSLFSSEMGWLLGFIFFTKVIKIWPHFVRYPQDLPLVIFQILFAYAHSIIKFWALITFWDCAWLGRNLDAVDAEAEHSQIPLDASFSWKLGTPGHRVSGHRVSVHANSGYPLWYNDY
ncbi:glycosyltransferase family 2 [Colletotrichum karsti]|uniref:Glycosyltransferase family 2 n=1 Tax=Colletotrichum karsti TaxID=1095194 RepID=A0A9P6LGK5_9PEZI|nr:glycosyltransferase family 2 [Colletotrichum karsti]KAF9872281.1 glycosyltransferase family 2 [Colletotrichum karsti]